MKMKLKTGDTVRVITGKDKGKEGKILRVDRKNDRVYVQGLNMMTKHAKPSAANQQGGIIHQEGSIHISNVMYVYKGKITRLGYKVDKNKKGESVKVRIAKSTGDVID